MYTLIVFVAGIVVGTIFHALFSKWGNAAKNAGNTIVKDIEVEAGKLKGHRP